MEADADFAGGRSDDAAGEAAAQRGERGRLDFAVLPKAVAARARVCYVRAGFKLP